MQTVKLTAADLRALADDVGESGEITGLTGLVPLAGGGLRGRVMILTDVPAACEPASRFLSGLLTDLANTPADVLDAAEAPPASNIATAGRDAYRTPPGAQDGPPESGNGDPTLDVDTSAPQAVPGADPTAQAGDSPAATSEAPPAEAGPVA